MTRAPIFFTGFCCCRVCFGDIKTKFCLFSIGDFPPCPTPCPCLGGFVTRLLFASLLVERAPCLVPRPMLRGQRGSFTTTNPPRCRPIFAILLDPPRCRFFVLRPCAHQSEPNLFASVCFLLFAFCFCFLLFAVIYTIQTARAPTGAPPTQARAKKNFTRTYTHPLVTGDSDSWGNRAENSRFSPFPPLTHGTWDSHLHIAHRFRAASLVSPRLSLSLDRKSSST